MKVVKPLFSQSKVVKSPYVSSIMFILIGLIFTNIGNWEIMGAWFSLIGMMWLVFRLLIPARSTIRLYNNHVIINGLQFDKKSLTVELVQRDVIEIRSPEGFVAHIDLTLHDDPKIPKYFSIKKK